MNGFPSPDTRLEAHQRSHLGLDGPAFVEVVKSAGTDDLETGYGVFREEALNRNSAYQPETVNTDGWTETQSAWKPLFPRMTLILCCLHSVKFQAAYDCPEAHRTSNALDRLMNHQDRYLYGMQYFGTMASATVQRRTMALLWTFHPYGPRTKLKEGDRSSPLGELNGFVNHENWLHNLLIAGSMNGYTSSG